MSRLAIMPLSDYQNLCNNIRDLTGTTGVIKSGDLVQKVGDVAENGGEDVTDETNAYTNKLVTLETAISALETELEGKASSGSGGGASGWINVASLPTTNARAIDPDSTIYYYEVPENCIGVIFIGLSDTFSTAMTYNTGLTRKINNVFSNLTLGPGSLIAEDADGTGTVLKITNTYNVAYLLPILSSDLS